MGQWVLELSEPCAMDVSMDGADDGHGSEDDEGDSDNDVDIGALTDDEYDVDLPMRPPDYMLPLDAEIMEAAVYLSRYNLYVDTKY
ncbi:hypothetical protein VNI00_016985 [Paramarasmius palmivorus]|uniref:Uncharacterized protein n=1 Tax=Paramarasmius palmivorus TaxID=297713 RepID=A0AAW0BCZ2_9AGAR